MSGEPDFDYSQPLIAFVEDMRAALAKNSHKGNWRRDGMRTFLRRCTEELEEVGVAMDQLSNLPGGWREFFDWYDERPRKATVRRNPETGKIEMSSHNARRLEGVDRIEQLGKVIAEAADVANFAMMMADKARCEIAEIQKDLSGAEVVKS